VIARLVIDTSVARSCGDSSAVHPTAIRCRAFLIALRSGRHEAVFSPMLSQEWKKHRSRFANQWLVSMTARKRVIRISPSDNNVGKQVEKMCQDSYLQDALKDCHLLHAALATDHSIVSLDEAVREIYRSLSKNIKELSNIVWVNPTLEEERPIEWLEQGAQPEPHRQLGYL
jgi:hypothetical protein